MSKQTCREALRFYTENIAWALNEPSTRAVAQSGFIAGWIHGASTEEAVKQSTDTNKMLSDVAEAIRKGMFFTP